MKPQQFQEMHGEALRLYLASASGQALLPTVSAFNPSFSINETPHLFAKEIGKREGFELCLKAIMSLCTAPKVQTEIEATYGIPNVKPM